MKKIYKLDIKENEYEEMDLDYFFNHNKEFVDYINKNYENKNIYFEYKGQYFKTVLNLNYINEWYKCEKCLKNCNKIFLCGCFLELLIGPNNNILIKKIEEYEAIFMDDNYDEFKGE